MKIRGILILFLVLLVLIFLPACTASNTISPTITSEAKQTPSVAYLIGISGINITPYVTYSGNNYSLTQDLVAAIKIPDNLSPHGVASDFSDPPIQIGYAGHQIYAIENIDINQAIAVEYLAPFENSIYYYFVKYDRVTTPLP